MRWVVFEDEQVELLYPIILARPAYAISCGSFRLIDWLRKISDPKCGVVRPYLEDIQKIDFEELTGCAPQTGEAVMLVNARIVPSVDSFSALKKLAERESSGAIWCDDSVAAIKFDARMVPPALNQRPADETSSIDREELGEYLRSDAVRLVQPVEERLSLFRYPHDIIDANQKILRGNLEYRIQHGEYRQAADGVFIAEGARLGDFVSTNTREGPIVLESNASVGPFSYLSGPGFVGHNTRLIEHAAIKDAVSVGHTVKIGGEVEASIIEPYTNKQHYGFLGHSYLGSWINLGAGTCNSDLKNTYGPINMEYPSGRVATGRQFVGCIMGDYSKTAINTGIFTGKTIGVCSMLYGFVTTNVASFVTYARLFGQITELPPEVMIATQKRMFQRRNVTQRPCDIELIRDMYNLTRAERQATGDQLSL